MKRLFILFLCVLTAFMLAGCTKGDAKSVDVVSNDEKLISGTDDSNYIELSKINDNVWVHTSYKDYNGSRTPSNGMVVITSQGLVLVDTPWNNEQTKELLKLTKEKFKQDVKLAIITHAHEDRIGGIDTLLENNIDVRSTKLTAQLAAKAGYKEPSPALDENPSIEIGDASIEVFYPGEGHSSDNITVWLPQYRVLFGGCIIKSLESQDIGSSADANLTQWPESVRKVQEEYPNAQIVIPGHGKWGSNKLINNTLELLEKGVQ